MRLYQYVPVWQSLGIEVEVSPLLGDDYIKRLYAKQPTNWLGVFCDYLRQVFKLLSARKFDLLWIEKELFPNLPASFERALRALGINYIVDYDDAIFHNYDLSRHPVKRFLSNKIDKVMHSSAMVVCGNVYLAERASSAGARRVEIIPTVIDLNRYSVFSPAERECIVIGWVGSPSTAKYLDVVVPALKTISVEFPLQLRVIGAQFISPPDLDIDCRPWSERTEVSEIQDFDIGIMPLTDSPWERGKCGYKLIQYMACAKAVVASPVGVNQQIVRNGINGYLATTVDEWIHALRELALNSQKRLTMGAKGREAVEKAYSVQVTAPRLAQLFNEVIEQKTN